MASPVPCRLSGNRLGRFGLICSLSMLLISLLSVPIRARSSPNEGGTQCSINEPAAPSIIIENEPWKVATHTINRMALAVTNRGVIGTATPYRVEQRDAFTGELVFDGAEFPRGSWRAYLTFLELWVGADMGHGPIVNMGGWYERQSPVEEGDMAPLDPPGEIERRSTTERFGPPHPEAVSEEDLLCWYNDSQRIARPGDYTYQLRDNYYSLGIGVEQASYGWSPVYAEDFILVELKVKNSSDRWLHNVCIGLYGDAGGTLSSRNSPCETPRSIAGLRNVTLPGYPCAFADSLQMAWSANATGEPVDGAWLEKIRLSNSGILCFEGSVRGALGILPLAAGSNLPMNYNWWAQAYLPEGYEGLPYSGSFFYEPTQDSTQPPYHLQWDRYHSVKERYRVLSSQEQDFPTYLAGAIARTYLTEYLRIPPELADSVAASPLVNVVLSWGPMSLPPGGEFPLTFAIVGGERLHVDPNNHAAHMPQEPAAYISALDFTDLDKNAVIASWVYDNPGIDTDGDGYRGEYQVCVLDSAWIGGEWVVQHADTLWFRGDGQPDFRGALPPPAPEVWVTPTHNGLHVRFNGQFSETEKDIFLQKPDFEGYRVYLGRDERETSLSVVGSYDREDFDTYLLDLKMEIPGWRLLDGPYTLAELRCRYGYGSDPCGDSTFTPDRYTQFSPYRHPAFPDDSIFWFQPHEYNASEFGQRTEIRRIYPDVPDPRVLPADSVTADMYTEDGYLKFFEYEIEVENLLPSIAYWVNVTSFDFGSPALGVTPLESSKTKGIIEAFPLHTLDQPLSGSDEIYVYPNPYRTDVDYRGMGLEGRNQDDRWDERVRSIWFGNLPPQCTIKIYTIDGDRVRTMEHDVLQTDPTFRKHKWDLINRNFQKVETGLYYWVVEVPGAETQMGKLAIIR